MFAEYDTAGIIWKTGLRQNGTGWQRFIENRQFSSSSQPPTKARTLQNPA
jgi:hypothetical protein